MTNPNVTETMVKAALQARRPNGHKVWESIPVEDHLDRAEIMECALDGAFSAADEELREVLLGPIWTKGAVQELDALTWYGENARLCRLIHSEGDPGRHALSDDGGERAREALDDFSQLPRAEASAPEPQDDGWREPYKPVILDFPNAGFSELVLADTLIVWDAPDANGVEVGRDEAGTRIAVRWPLTHAARSARP